MSEEHLIVSFVSWFDTREKAKEVWKKYIKIPPKYEDLGEEYEEYIGEYIIMNHHLNFEINYHDNKNKYAIEMILFDDDEIYYEHKCNEGYDKLLQHEFPELNFNLIVYSWYDGVDRP